MRASFAALAAFWATEGRQASSICMQHDQQQSAVGMRVARHAMAVMVHNTIWQSASCVFMLHLPPSLCYLLLYISQEVQGPGLVRHTRQEDGLHLHP